MADCTCHEGQRDRRTLLHLGYLLSQEQDQPHRAVLPRPGFIALLHGWHYGQALQIIERPIQPISAFLSKSDGLSRELWSTWNQGSNSGGQADVSGLDRSLCQGSMRTERASASSSHIL